MSNVNEILDMISYIMEDPAIQKNIRAKLEQISSIMKASTKKDEKLKIDKCIDILSNVCEDTNIQSFVRTQLYQLSGMLESIEH